MCNGPDLRVISVSLRACRSCSCDAHEVHCANMLGAPSAHAQNHVREKNCTGSL